MNERWNIPSMECRSVSNAKHFVTRSRTHNDTKFKIMIIILYIYHYYNFIFPKSRI